MPAPEARAATDVLPTRRGRRLGPDAATVAAPALVLLAIGLWLSSLGTIHPLNSSDYGLVGQLPPAWWVSVAVVVAALLIGSRTSTHLDARWTTYTMVFGTAALALILHGTASATESVPRFPVAYLHAGFAQYIAQTGHTLPRLDARMSWPGFFAGVATVSRAMNVDQTWFIKWAPLVSNLAYLLPLKVIANASLESTRARWAALWIFLAANWIGQDYFSPQGMNLFLYLTVVAVICRAFASTGPAWGPARRVADSRPALQIRRVAARILRIPSSMRSTGAPNLELPAGARMLLYGLMLLVVFASVSSHQLTPVMIAIMAAALALTGRTRLSGLWVLCATAVAAWTSFLAVTYWSGHLSSVFGSVGNVSGTVTQNVQGRLHGSTAHLEVVRVRIVFALMIWGMAAIAFLQHLRRGRSHWTLATLFLCPFAVLVGQGYGGEAVLRIYLFALAPASILIASLLDHERRDNANLDKKQTSWRERAGRRLAPLAWVATLVVALTLFPIARWGNERAEGVSRGDLDAVQWVYANVPQGATLVAADAAVPWRYAHIADYRYRLSVGLLFDFSPSDIYAVLVGYGAHTYLILTRDQGESGALTYGVEHDWLDRMGRALAGSHLFRIVYRNPDAFVVRLLVGGKT